MGISFLDKAGGRGGKGKLSSQETASTKSCRHTRTRLVTAEWAEHGGHGLRIPDEMFSSQCKVSSVN